MKVNVLAELLSQTPTQVEVTLITRWDAHALVTGANDLEIFGFAHSRPATYLLLHPSLHAKYYSSESAAFAGSANLTNRGLGWSPASNLEMLIPLAPDSSLRQFEANLLAASSIVDVDLYHACQAQVQNLRTLELHASPRQTASPLGDLPAAGSSNCDTLWFPALRNPDLLYKAYLGRTDVLSSSSRDAAIHDLHQLSLPPKLTKIQFRAAVSLHLLQNPFVVRLDRLLAEHSLPFGRIKSELQEYARSLSLELEPVRTWQTLMRWLLHFLPDRYSTVTPRHSEVFCRIS